VNLIVVPDFVPRIVVLPLAELLITTSACVAPARFASVTPVIVPTIESPVWTLHFVRLCGSPVFGSPPVGRSRLPGALLSGSIPLSAMAGCASARNATAMTALTSQDVATRRQP
jgi:hypothetical protein